MDPKSSIPTPSVNNPVQPAPGMPLQKISTPKFAFTRHLRQLPARAVLLSLGISVFVLLIGGGSTYFVASNFFAPKKNINRISESSKLKGKILVLPTQVSSSSAAIIPTTSITPTLALTPAPVASPAAGWTRYFFAGASLSFYYPQNWFVDLADTSGAPYLHVQNFTPTGSLPVSSQGQYAFLISRLDEVGISSISALLDTLTKKVVNPVFLEGKNMGIVTVLAGNTKTVNGYAAYERTVSYSNFPTSQYYELYVLDGKSKVVKFLPELDTAHGISYFNTLISTVSFLN